MGDRPKDPTYLLLSQLYPDRGGTLRRSPTPTSSRDASSGVLCGIVDLGSGTIPYPGALLTVRADDVPTIEWSDGTVRLIDQTLLPHTEEVLEITSPEQMVDAIKRLAVRGAPAIGVAGAYGVALAARRYGTGTPDFERAVAELRDARPTAVNLARMVDRAAACAPEGPDRILEEAHRSGRSWKPRWRWAREAPTSSSTWWVIARSGR